jgi:hypothetical protein
MSATVTVRVEGLAELRQKLKGPPRIYLPPVRKALGGLAKEGARVLRSRSTRMTGKLQKSIRPTSRASGLFAAVRFDPVASQHRGSTRPFRSGWAFDKSSKFTSRSGGLTKGWISQAPPLLQGAANRFVETAGKEIEAAWND